MKKMKVVCSLVCLMVVFGLRLSVFAAQESIPLSGKGTCEAPYLIQSVEDLKWFRDAVNAAKHFEGIYFKQTKNLDLNAQIWEPIGVFGTDCYFAGYYDGAGHYIENLNMIRGDNCALFAVLAGTVSNLGIESGMIEGACVAGIAGHSQGDRAKVINCYNKAAILGGYRAGGIVDNFEGEVYNCVNMGTLEAPVIGQVAGYHVKNAVYGYGIDEEMWPADTFGGREYGCEYIVLGVPETRAVVEQMNKNVYWLKQDMAVDVGDLCYWEYADGEIAFSKTKPYSDWSNAFALKGIECVCVGCLGCAVGLWIYLLGTSLFKRRPS